MLVKLDCCVVGLREHEKMEENRGKRTNYENVVGSGHGTTILSTLHYSTLN